MKTFESNILIMVTLIYTKQIIHLSSLLDETSFFVRDKLILVLQQKDDLDTWYTQIIWYARLPLKYNYLHLFTDRILAMNLMGVNQYSFG